MRHELNLWVAGGDLRQAKLAELLAADGHTVHTWALEGHGPLAGVHAEEDPAGAELADCMILPLPAEEEGGLLHAPLSDRPRPLEELLAPLRPGQLVCAGMVGPALTALAAEQGLVLQDYFAREELAVANAVPTALAKGHQLAGYGKMAARPGGHFSWNLLYFVSGNAQISYQRISLASRSSWKELPSPLYTVVDWGS